MANPIATIQSKAAGVADRAVRDEVNPAFMFQTIDTALLVQAVRGEIDVNKLVRQELANRGLDWSGRWVGFEKAGFLAKCYPTRINGKLVPMPVPDSE